MKIELNYVQTFLVAELKDIIKSMRVEGADCQDIRDKCVEKGRGQCLVTDIEQQDYAIGAALYLYGLDEEGREAMDMLMTLFGGGK